MKQLLLALGLGIWLVSPVQAAEIIKANTELCDLSLTGEIRQGDAKELDRQKANWRSKGGYAGDGLKLCLDSPGGSLSEGLELFEMIWAQNIKTHVLPGANCESACALAFLGGSYLLGTGVTREMRREIWPDGRLGFHGPRLVFPANIKFPGDQVSKAFDVAMEIAAQVYEINRLQDRENGALTDHLVHRFLNTSPDDMYFIDTVGDVILSEIGLNGVDYSNAVTPGAIRNVCNNIYLKGEFPLVQGHTESIHKDFTSAAALNRRLLDYEVDDFTIEVEQLDGLIRGFAGPYPITHRSDRIGCFVSISEGLANFEYEDFDPDEGEISVEISRYYAIRENDNFSFSGWLNEGETIEVRDVAPWYLLDFATPLSDLPKSAAYHSARRQYAQQSGKEPSIVATTAADFVSFPGFDLPGGDVGLVRNATLETCRQSCDADDKCTAYTHDRWNNLCFLKSAADTSNLIYVQPKADSYIAPSFAALIRSARTNIVMKKRNNKAFFDSPYYDFESSSFSQCASFCAEEDKCLGVNFSGNLCEMFDHPEVYNDRLGTQIGLKLQQLPE
ncbi:hypothetical protein EBB79_17100 [Parasedimentitalea marina]|uniref:Apple domain-containing protein n=1 Tax=Parasedimentitalea marina TaxID=2483033 RepID=A0A3T0N638_9RHOB|nr:PAN domain-containing protein [Parasedimentitalea marina]AZV79422.1 hypothetical protein EBB79_17100 [Parasedimentitalea marina]